jgi:hypothetical protein
LRWKGNHNQPPQKKKEGRKENEATHCNLLFFLIFVFRGNEEEEPEEVLYDAKPF